MEGREAPALVEPEKAILHLVATSLTTFARKKSITFIGFFLEPSNIMLVKILHIILESNSFIIITDQC